MARKPKESVTDRKEAIAKTGDLAKAAPAKADKPTPKADKPAATPKPAPVEKVAKTDKPEAEAGDGKTRINRDKYGYTSNRDQKTAGGRASVDNNDALASALRGMPTGDVIDLVATNGGEVNPKWENLNQGLARMAAGNALRKLAKRSEGIKIKGEVIRLENTQPMAKAA